MLLEIFFLISTLKIEIPALPRDDDYHHIILPVNDSKTYVIQPNEKASIMFIYENANNLIVEKREIGGEYAPINLEDLYHGEDIEGVTSKQYIPKGNNPFELRINCSSAAPHDECDFVVRHVHTTPVFKVSIVIGAFSLFVCLFTTVFIWTIFCGACRATRRR